MFFSVTMSQIPVSTPFSNVTSGATSTFKPLTTSTTIGVMSVSTSGQLQVTVPSGVMTQSILQSKDINIATLCRHGQEMVEDIVQKTTEIFQWLKTIYVSVVIVHLLDLTLVIICRSRNLFSVHTFP